MWNASWSMNGLYRRCTMRGHHIHVFFLKPLTHMRESFSVVLMRAFQLRMWGYNLSVVCVKVFKFVCVCLCGFQYSWVEFGFICECERKSTCIQILNNVPYGPSWCTVTCGMRWKAHVCIALDVPMSNVLKCHCVLK